MTYSSYQVKTTTWINLYRYFGLYAKKDSSAWTEVWSGASPSRAPIYGSQGGFCQSPSCIQENVSMALARRSRAGRPNPQKAAKFDLCVFFSLPGGYLILTCSRPTCAMLLWQRRTSLPPQNASKFGHIATLIFHSPNRIFGLRQQWQQNSHLSRERGVTIPLDQSPTGL